MLTEVIWESIVCTYSNDIEEHIMGYETKIYFVEALARTFTDNLVKGGDKWHNYYSDKAVAAEGHEKFYHYRDDGNTRTYFDKSAMGSEDLVTRKYANPIAQMDLCKVGRLPTKESEYFVYADDGDTPVVTDRYGEYLGQMSLRQFIAWVYKEMEESDYRRLKTAKALAESFLGGYSNVQVLTYGH